MKLAVIDLDGTLFDERHRNHLAKEGNWDAYNRAHIHDTLFDEIKFHVEYLSSIGYEIVFLTGRSQSCVASTVCQLDELFEGYRLFMRQVGDLRKSSVFKSSKLREILKSKDYSEVYAVDDQDENLLSMKTVILEKLIPFTLQYASQGEIKDFCQFDGLIQRGTAIEVEDSIDLPAPTAEILRLMADTFEERNKVYGSNYERVAPIMKILFPDGLTPEILHSDQWHLFELIVVKMTRFAISGLQHKDSIHDTGVYSAMIESILEKQNG